MGRGLVAVSWSAVAIRERGSVLAETNMVVLRPSRKKLRPGDIFVMQYQQVGFLFGRVIRVDIPRGKAPMPGCNLIYIYDERSPMPDLERVRLTPDHLLIPPSFINRLPWSRGYFETIRSAPLLDEDLLQRHCFDASFMKRISFRDLEGAELDRPTQPCGKWGLHSYASLDDEISDALHIARVPEWTPSPGPTP